MRVLVHLATLLIVSQSVHWQDTAIIAKHFFSNGSRVDEGAKHQLKGCLPVLQARCEADDQAEQGRAHYRYAARILYTSSLFLSISGASSVAGKQGMQLSSAYSMSKFAVRGLIQCAGRMYL